MDNFLDGAFAMFFIFILFFFAIAALEGGSQEAADQEDEFSRIETQLEDIQEDVDEIREILSE